MTQDQVDKKIYDHDHWCHNPTMAPHGNFAKQLLTGKVFANADLNRATFRDACLSEAIMNDCDLSFTDFRDATLFEADLTNADFSNADLEGADFRCSNLQNANFIDADWNKIRLNDAWIDGLKITVRGKNYKINLELLSEGEQIP